MTNDSHMSESGSPKAHHAVPPLPPPLTMEDMQRQIGLLTETMDKHKSETDDVLRSAETEFSRLRDDLAKTKIELKAAQEEIRQLKQSGGAYPVNPAKNEAKGADPPFFSGTQRDLEAWITACRLRFVGQPSKFDTEAKKVIFASSFLKGPPMAWFQPVINAYATSTSTGEEVPAEFQSFEGFVSAIRTLYGNPNLQRDAELQLRFLRQGERTVAEYIAKFTTLSQNTSYDDASLTACFYHGLTSTIKDELVNKEWKKLKGLQDLTTRLDARMRERKYEKEQEAKMFFRQTVAPKYNPPRRDDGTYLPTKTAWAPAPASVATPHPAPAPPAPTADGSTPMELDTQRFRVQMSEDERARCRAESRCFYCKKVGHDARNCNARPRVATIQVQPAENDDAQE
jgi:hypothetical protein